MLTDEHIGEVRGLVPFGLARHIVGDLLAVDDEIVEVDAGDRTAVVVTRDERHAGMGALIGDVAQGDVANAATGRMAVLLVVAHAEVEEIAQADILDANVAEGDAVDEDIVAVVDGYAALIVYLPLVLLEDVDVVVDHVSDGLVLLDVAVESNHDGVGHVSPVYGVVYTDVAAAAMIVLSRAVDGGAVITGPTEDMIIIDMV